MKDLKQGMMKFVADGESPWYRTPLFSRTKANSRFTHEEKAVRVTTTMASSCIANSSYTQPYGQRIDFIRFVKAVAAKHQSEMARSYNKLTLQQFCDNLLDPVGIEFFANAGRWKLHTGLTRATLSTGTTGNEGDNYDFKSWGRNIQSQGKDRAIMIIDFFVMSKVLAHFGAVALPRPIRQHEVPGYLLCLMFRIVDVTQASSSTFSVLSSLSSRLRVPHNSANPDWPLYRL